jgi:hypothetical protein
MNVFFDYSSCLCFGLYFAPPRYVAWISTKSVSMLKHTATEIIEAALLPFNVTINYKRSRIRRKEINR